MQVWGWSRGQSGPGIRPDSLRKVDGSKRLSRRVGAALPVQQEGHGFVIPTDRLCQDLIRTSVRPSLARRIEHLRHSPIHVKFHLALGHERHNPRQHVDVCSPRSKLGKCESSGDHFDFLIGSGCWVAPQPGPEPRRPYLFGWPTMYYPRSGLRLTPMG